MQIITMSVDQTNIENIIDDNILTKDIKNKSLVQKKEE